MRPQEAMSKLIAGDLTRDEKRVLTHVGFRLAWRVIMLAFITYALGFWVAFNGPSGFALASDVDSKIKAAIEPLNKSVKDLNGAVDRL